MPTAKLRITLQTGDRVLDEAAIASTTSRVIADLIIKKAWQKLRFLLLSY